MSYGRLLVLVAVVLAGEAGGGTGLVTVPAWSKSLRGSFIHVFKDGTSLVAGTEDRRGDDGIYTLGTFVLKLKADGEVDAAFGERGAVGTRHLFTGAKVLDDGRFVVTGASHGEVPRSTGFWVGRYLPDGKPDKGFGNGGELVVDFGEGEESPNGLALDEKGNLTLMALVDRGGFDPKTSTTHFAAIRVTPDGKLDGNFGEGGKIFVDKSLGQVGAEALFLRPGGGFLAVVRDKRWTRHSKGSYALGVGPKTQVIALTPSGELDTKFADGGRRSIEFPAPTFLSNVVQGPDGSLYLAGDYRDPKNKAEGGWIAKLSAEGAPVTSFGKGGIAQLPKLHARDIAFADGGKLLVVGSWGAQAAPLGIGRLLPTGAVDTSFGKGGYVAEGPTSVSGGLGAIAVAPSSEKFVVTAAVPRPPTVPMQDQDLLVARFTADGTLDAAGFGVAKP